MARLRCDFDSDVLGLSTSMTVLLPQESANQIGISGRARRGAPPVLYLLHGLSDDDTTWARFTSIERYAASLGLVVVMPQVHRSFYTNEKIGLRYFTFLTEELPAIVRSWFVVSTERSDTFVAGLSMGGYGALKWALRRPDRFAAAASLSGALDIVDVATFLPDRVEDRRAPDRLFDGKHLPGSDVDLSALLQDNVDEGVELPALFVACGSEDGLLPANQRFIARCNELGVPVTTDLGPGEHEWGYWDAKIRDVLAWLPVR